MAASILSGVLVFVFAAFIVDVYLRSRELGRWQSVARLACNSLGDELTRTVVTSLAVLWQERGFQPVSRDKARPGWNTNALLPVHEIRSIPAGRAEVAVLDRTPVPHAKPCDDAGFVSDERLAALLLDPAWRRWATEHLRPLRKRLRELLAEWSGVMLLADRPKELLNRTAQLIDQVGYLREGIEKMTQESDHDRAVAKLVEDWQRLDLEARALTNDFWREAGQGHYAFVTAPYGPSTPRDGRSAPGRSRCPPA